MHGEGTLELFAELFVAFAGFTALAGVILRSSSEGASLRQEVRLLLEYSLFYVVLSTLPLVFFYAGLSESSAWRLACAVSAIQTTIYYALRFGSLRRWTVQTGTSSQFWFTCTVDCLFVALLVAAAAAIGPLSAISVYLLHLLWGLIGSALSFVRLARPIWQAAIHEGAA